MTLGYTLRLLHHYSTLILHCSQDMFTSMTSASKLHHMVDRRRLGHKKTSWNCEIIIETSFVSAGHVHEHDLRFKAAPRGGR